MSAYMQLFVHRKDVYAEQREDGAYIPVHEELTEWDVQEHLAGFRSLGVYTTTPDDHKVNYVVFDLDTHDHDAWNELCRLVVKGVLALTDGVTCECLLAESSGNKGKHVWLFFSEPVEARRARHWAHEAVGTPWVEWVQEQGENHGVVPGALEIFPKQDFVPEGGFGNLVKLPFGVHAVSGNRSEIIPKHGWANVVEDVRGLDPKLLPEAPASSPRSLLGSGRGEPVSGRVTPFPCVTEILDNGVGSGARDNAIFHAAVYLYGHGIDEDLALEMCLRANQKFDPPLPDSQVGIRVRSAYRGRYSGASCGSGWLAEICPGPCKSGWKVGRTVESGALSRAEVGSTVEVTVKEVVRERARHRLKVEHPDAENTPTFVVTRS